VADDVVLAVDPGGMTGWVVWNGGDGSGVELEGQQDYEDFCEQLDLLFSFPAGHFYRPTHIIVEAYDITGETLRKSRQYEALYLIGVLKYIAHREGVELIISQRSNKAFSTDDRLDAAHWLSRPKHELRHQNDAKRHLLTWLVRTKRMEVPR
jgi:hypothetical protein